MNSSIFEEAAVRRVLSKRYNHDSRGLTFEAAKAKLEGEIASEVDRLTARKATTQPIKTTLYRIMGWGARRIRKYERKHDTKGDFFIIGLETKTILYLYKKYVTAETPKRKTKKMARSVPSVGKIRATEDSVKRGNPRKDQNRSIEDLDVSESELAELKESKALHATWTAFRLEHQETIQNDLSEEEYAWLGRAIPQAIKSTVLHTATELWKQSKVSGDTITEHKKTKIVLLQRIVAAKKRIRSQEIKILKMLFPKSTNLEKKTLVRSDVAKFYGLQQGLINTNKDVKNAKKNLAKLKQIQADIRKKTRLLTMWRDLLIKENEKISKLEKGFSRAAGLFTPREEKNVIFW